MDESRSTLAVDGGGGKAFRTIGEAIAALERERAAGGRGGALILVAPGTYREKLFLDQPDVELRGLGRGPEDTRIVWGDYAKLPLPDGRPMRTFNTATLFAGGDRVRIENLTIENDAGPGERVGQAVAAYVDADGAVISNCRLVGRQDTLFTGPLPPKPIEGDDFGGPRDSGPGRRSAKPPLSPAVGRQRYEGCLIEGDVDFIFGSAEAVFRDCEIRSRARGRGLNGWVSAASTPRPLEGGSALRDLSGWLRPDEVEALALAARASGREIPPLGHLFYGCALSCEEGTAAGSVYLGRPWRDYARTIYARCELGAHIAPAGWDDWGKASARAVALYVELGCFGPGAAAESRAAERAARRAAWATIA